ncbi:MAG TPA: HEAT repeat domain-containing protein [Terriglobales bacterium]|nr:HEAT repeat domain-containing protein [Terriglobales bacterium]
MRIILLSVIAASATVTAASAQQTSAFSASREKLLVELRSDDSQVRSRAFGQLRSDPSALRDPDVKAALVHLLDRENQEPIHAEEEDFADYASWLAEVVAKIVDWSDPRQVCVLANSIVVPDELADHAKVAVPCLLRRLRNGLNRYAPGADTSRGSVVAMLVQASAKGRRQLDASTIQRVRRIILNALHDSDAGVRIDTVRVLGRFGDEDMIPALKVVAEKDPDPSESYAVRKEAAEAIVGIQERVHRDAIRGMH